MVCRIKHSSFFNFSNAAWNADNHFQVREKATLGTDHIDHPLDHAFSGLEVGDYAIFQWPDSFNVLMGLFMHLHCTVAHCNGLPCADVDSDDGWFIDDYVAVLDDQRVSCA